VSGAKTGEAAESVPFPHRTVITLSGARGAAEGAPAVDASGRHLLWVATSLVDAMETE
jgi:hypothetical protein